MSLDLPAHGDSGWDVKLNAALTQLNTQDTTAAANLAAEITRATAAEAANATAITAEATARATAITSAITALVNGAPGALDTLNELAAALTADEGTAATLAALVATKAPIASPTFTGVPAAPTAAPGTNTTQVGTTAFTTAAVAAEATARNAAIATASATSGTVLVPTAVKTSSYTAAVNDYVPVDTTSGNVTVTLPTAPADKTQVGIKHVVRGGTNTVTLALGGSDVLNKTGGSTSATLTLVNQAVTLQYKATGAIWYVVGGELPLSGLDARFQTAAAGSTSGLTAPVESRGLHAPKGWGAAWFTARNASATTRCEVVGAGDSLLFGQGPSTGLYSFMQRLRERSVSAGYTDGGRGINWTGSQTPLDNFTGEVAPISAQTGFAATGLGGLISFGQGFVASGTGGDSVTYKVVGTKARLWWSRYTTAGRFSYKVNAASTVTVNAGSSEAAPLPAASSGVSSLDCIMLTSADGLTSGTNTIVVTNLGGTPVIAPTVTNGGQIASGGTLAAGTYSYAATTVAASGETAIGASFSRAVTSGQEPAVNTPTAASVGGATSFNIYRALGAGAFGLIGNIAASGSAGQFIDTGFAAGVAPPSSSTAGLNAASSVVVVNVEALNDAGIVWQNQGVQGAVSADVSSVIDPLNNAGLIASLGLAWGTTANGLGVGTSSELLPTQALSNSDSPIARTTARRPSLFIWAFGTNDIQKGDAGTTTPAPTAATAGAGIGSGLAAATYFYKVQRLTTGQGSAGPLSAASSGVVVTAGQQVLVTAPSLGSGSPVGYTAFAVYRSTSSGGTYGFVGQIDGNSQYMLDNIATPGPAPFSITSTLPIVDTTVTVNSLSLALRLARNAGADSLVVLPSIENMTNSRVLGGPFKAAIQNVAESFGAAWVDFDVALGPLYQRVAAGYQAGLSANPHLLKPAYVAQGDFAWTLLGL